MTTQQTTRQILDERGTRYGPFSTHADYTQRLKQICYCSKNWDRMDYAMREALEMIAHKIGRILNGDPNYVDSWQDIAGYAQLVVDLLEGKEPGKAYYLPPNTLLK